MHFFFSNVFLITIKTVIFFLQIQEKSFDGLNPEKTEGVSLSNSKPSESSGRPLHDTAEAVYSLSVESDSEGNAMIPQHEAAITLLEVVTFLSSRISQVLWQKNSPKCDDEETENIVPSNSSSSMEMNCSYAQMWGSNANHQISGEETTRIIRPQKVEFPAKTKQIAAGHHCSFTVDTAGRVVARGDNMYGRVGLDDRSKQTSPIYLVFPRAVQVCCVVTSHSNIDGHTLALSTTGQVYSWGYSDYGALGLGNVKSVHEPTLVTSLSNKVKAISVGHRHSAAVTSKGLLYTWGDGIGGKLGHCNETSRTVPTKVRGMIGVTGVECGSCHTFAWSPTTVWAMGTNEYRRLGFKATNNLLSPTVIDELQQHSVSKIVTTLQATIALTTDNQLFSWGNGACLGRQSREGSIGKINLLASDEATETVVDICSGENHVLALTSEGRVFGWV